MLCSCPNAHLLVAVPIRCWPVLLLLFWFLLLHVCYRAEDLSWLSWLPRVTVWSPAAPEMPALEVPEHSRSRANGTRGINSPRHGTTPSPEWPVFLLGSTTSRCLSVSHIASGPFPLTAELKPSTRDWMRKKWHTTCTFPYSFYHKSLPLPHVFKMDTPETGKHYVYKHVYKKKWVNRHLYNFRWLRLGSGVTKTGFESLIYHRPATYLISPNSNIVILSRAIIVFASIKL